MSEENQPSIDADTEQALGDSAEHERAEPPVDSGFPGAARFLIRLIVITTVLMIVIGAMVTSIRSGDSDPTWKPHSAIEWVVNWLKSESTVGLRFELGHRIIGVLVGFEVLALLAMAIWKPRVKRIRGWVILLTVFVILQGVIGGVRVLVFQETGLKGWVLETFHNMPAGSYDSLDSAANNLATLWRNYIAMGHGALAQVTFTLMCVLWLVSSRCWHESKSRVAEHRRSFSRFLAWSASVLLLVQLVFGTYVRQFSHLNDEGIAIHVAMALLLVLLVLWQALRAQRFHRDLSEYRKAATALAALTCLQIFLGLAPWMLTRGEVYVSHHTDEVSILRICHVLNGAILLATSVCAALLIGRSKGPE